MKNIRKFITYVLLCSFLSVGVSSCVVFKKQNGKKKGWYKNTKNPHNPNTTNKKAKN